MGEEAGKLEVEYVVISAVAMRRLDRLEKQFEKVENAATKQAKSMEKQLKSAGKAMAIFGAVITGVLYGIIKSSSYASMWMDQLKYTTMRFADKLLILTGAKDDIDDLFNAADKFLDLWEDEGLTYAIVITMTDLKDWWDDLSTTKKVIYALLFAVVTLGVGLTVFAGISAWLIWVLGALGITVTAAGIGAAALTVAIYAAAVAVGVMVGAIAVWLLTKIGVMQWFSDLGEGFRSTNSRLKDQIKVTIGYFGALGLAFVDLAQGDYKFTNMNNALDEIEAAQARLDPFFGGGKSGGYGFGGSWEDSTLDTTDALEDVNTAQFESAKTGLAIAIANYEAMEDVTDEGLDQQLEAILYSIAEMEEANRRLGHAAQTGFSTEFDKIPDNVGLSLGTAASNAEIGTGLINSSMGNLKTDYIIDIITRYNGKSAWDGGGSHPWDAPGGGEGTWAPGWQQIGADEPTAPGQPDVFSATGGHVLRSGTAVIHQGEDIVNLNKMMAGARFDNSGSKEVVINNTINITGGNLSNPMEVGRVADTISRRMGEELHRISTSI